jgi:hypothetical protein
VRNEDVDLFLDLCLAVGSTVLAWVPATRLTDWYLPPHCDCGVYWHFPEFYMLVWWTFLSVVALPLNFLLGRLISIRVRGFMWAQSYLVLVAWALTFLDGWL